MKKTRPETREGFGKLLDAWTPPEDAGSPIGCIATTYTFDAAFFEEECLARFLNLETDANEQSTAYYLEREERAAKINCAAVLVDQHQVTKAIRSLRWDLLIARLPRGILHAKVSLLLWSNRLRLIVASANLTEPGYRRNHEVFTVLDYLQDSSCPLSVLDEFIVFLRDAAKLASPVGLPSPAVNRWSALLDRAEKMSRDWGAIGEQRSSDHPRVFAVLTGPTRISVFDQLKQWLEQRPDISPLHRAFVISPFFDGPERSNRPAKEIWSLLKKRGEVEVEYQVTVEEVPGTDGLLLHAPKSCQAVSDNRNQQCRTLFSQLKLEDDRPLHAKCLWFENDSTILHLIGSSNFTSQGLGLGTTTGHGAKKNVEANLCFEVNRQRQPRLAKALVAAWLESTDVLAPDDCGFLPDRDDEAEDSASDVELLPEAFGDAIYSRDAQEQAWIEFVFRPEAGAPPDGWSLFFEDSNELFVGETQWLQEEKRTPWRVLWNRSRPPIGFEVGWPAGKSRVWWPVTVESGQSLPPPDELRNLPLELLIEVLTSSRPLHQVLAKQLERQGESAKSELAAELDPHRRVDTSGFLLQRTRRVAWALTAMRERLEQPVASEQALHWRLHGPVGVLALARAITDQARTIERGFFLAELCLELHRVQPQTENAKSLPVKDMRAAIRQVIEALREQIPPEALDPSATGEFAALAKYVKSVVAKVSP